MPTRLFRRPTPPWRGQRLCSAKHRPGNFDTVNHGVSDKTPHVALLIETSREYGRALLRGVARYNQQHGPWSIFFKPHGWGDAPPKWLADWQGHGILARIGNKRMLEAVRQTGLPAIDLQGVMGPVHGVPFIGVDNEVVTKLAARHLLDRGFKRFGFVGLPEGEHPHMDERRDHFRRFIEQAGFKCEVFEPKRYRGKPVPWEQQQGAIAEWLTRTTKPIGVMACHDDRGHQVIDAARRAGVLVPDEVAVVSVDNDEQLCSLAATPLSSVDVNAERIGYDAAAMLHRWMTERDFAPPTEPVYNPPRGVVTRRSTEVLAMDDRQIAHTIRYIRENACNGISVEDVLDQVPLSRSVLERRFKSLLGRTPKSEIMRVQLERARQLLTETDMPLSTIAEKTGFSQSKYFCEVFRKKVGVTPGKFRKQDRGEQ